MKTHLRFAPLALVALPLFSQAQQRVSSASAARQQRVSSASAARQQRVSSAVGLEIPASAAPASGHWLSGAYVTGSYSPVLAPGLAGYGVQPYLR